MVVAAFISGSKGGTGKTTLCTLLSLISARKGFKTLIIDLGESGNSTTLLTGGTDPPYFTDYLTGNAEWGDTVVEVRENLYLAPTPPDFSLKDVEALLGVSQLYRDRYSAFISGIKNYVDAVFIDFPAFPFKSYGFLLTPASKSVLIVNPDPLSFSAALHTYTGSTYVVPVLNKYHPAATYWRDVLEDRYGEVVTIPFDVTLSFLIEKTILDSIRYIDKTTLRALNTLLDRIMPLTGSSPSSLGLRSQLTALLNR